MHSVRYKILSILLLIILGSIFFTTTVNAAETCTASVSPNSIEASVTTSFSFSITNTGDGGIIYIKVTRPTGNFSLFNDGGVPSPWIAGVNSVYSEIYNGTVSSGNTLNFTLGANVGPEVAASEDWTIQMIVTGSLVTCTGGPFGTEVVAAGDTTGPTLSQPSVSNVTKSSATISWTTNEASDSTVNYGTSLSYGSTLYSETMTTSHTLTITGLNADTTYYYEIKSKDASSNSSQSSGYNFTTASANTTTTTTATATPTPTATTSTTTATASPTATPKVFVDNIGPVVKLTTDFSDSFEQAPLIEGTAEDASSSLGKIEYSIDGGDNWLPVDDTSSSTTKSAAFSFTPNLSEDGNYQIVARATDSVGNIGESETSILIIDRLPPSVGGNLIYLGPHPLLPNQDGVIVTMAGLAQKITLSAVGGPTSIDLYANNKMFSLAHSSQTGLWNGTIIFDSPGIYQLKTKAVDGAGNKTERDINTVLVMRSGQITSDSGKSLQKAKITVYNQNELSREWAVWDAKAFSQENPQNIEDDGSYEFFLPAGTYYLQVSSPGYQTLTTKIFKINSSIPLNADFVLTKATGFNIGPFTFAIPNIFVKQADVVIKSPKIPESVSKSVLYGQEIKAFTLPTQTGNFDSHSLKGEKSVITFVSSWSPPAVEQISAIDKAIYDREINDQLITTQETPSKLEIFLKRGGYLSQIAVDRDGETIEQFHINSLPTHYFLDRTGTVEKVVTGVLNVDEIKGILDSI
jgi:hypothetical protein